MWLTVRSPDDTFVPWNGLKRLLNKGTSMAALPEGVEMFTIDEVADILRFDRVTVLNLLQNGALIGFRDGLQWRITRESLERFMSPDENQDPQRPIDNPDFEENDGAWDVPPSHTEERDIC
jgi:excisionase family DNA binding protein